MKRVLLLFIVLMLICTIPTFAVTKASGLKMDDREYSFTLSSNLGANGFLETIVIAIENNGETSIELRNLVFNVYTKKFYCWAIDPDTRFLDVPLKLNPGEKIIKKILFSSMEFSGVKGEKIDYSQVKSVLEKCSWSIQASISDWEIIKRNPLLSSSLVYSELLRFEVVK